MRLLQESRKIVFFGVFGFVFFGFLVLVFLAFLVLVFCFLVRLHGLLSVLVLIVLFRIVYKWSF